MPITWKKHHASSGFSSFRTKANGCELMVSPKDWSKPTGPAIWSATCGKTSSKNFDHKRGDAKTVAGAKSAAKRASATLKR